MILKPEMSPIQNKKVRDHLEMVREQSSNLFMTQPIENYKIRELKNFDDEIEGSVRKPTYFGKKAAKPIKGDHKIKESFKEQSIQLKKSETESQLMQTVETQAEDTEKFKEVRQLKMSQSV